MSNFAINMKNFSKNNYYRDLIKLGIPIIIGQLGTIVLGFADTLMIGHHGTQDLAAAGLVNNVFNLVLLFYLGFSYGLIPLVGNLYGRGKHQEIGQKVKNSLLANFLIGLLLMLVMTIVYFNLENMGQPKELLSLIRPYFIVNVIGLPFIGLFNGLKQFFDGITHAKVSMWVMIIANLLNILFNGLLIYGYAGFPELGLLGAGIATLGSRVFMGIVLLCILLGNRKFAIYKQGLIQGIINRKDMKDLNALGWPIALQLGMETAAFALSCIMVGWIGTTALAAHQVMVTIGQLFCLILSGVATAASIRISVFYGQNNYSAVIENAKDCFRLELIIAMIIAIPVIIFRNQIGGCFTDNTEVQHMVSIVIFTLIAYQFGDGLQYTYANALRGIACVRPMVLYAFIAYFVISLPLGYLLGIHLKFDLVGIWTAFPISLSVAGIQYYLRFKKEMNLKMAQGY